VFIIGGLSFGCADGNRPKQQIWVRNEVMKYQKTSYDMDGMQMDFKIHRILLPTVAGSNGTVHNVTWDGNNG
jgi:hypothetical protein